MGYKKFDFCLTFVSENLAQNMDSQFPNHLMQQLPYFPDYKFHFFHPLVRFLTCTQSVLYIKIFHILFDLYSGATYSP